MKLRVGKTLSEGARILKENPVIFVPAGIYAALGSIFTYFTMNYYQYGEAPTETAELTGVLSGSQYILGFGIYFIIHMFILCIIIRLVYDATRGGGSFSSAVTIAAKKFIPVLIAGIMSFLIVGSGMLLLLIPGIFLVVKLLFWTYIILIEDEKIFSAISKSWNIVKGNWWRLFFLLVIFTAILAVPFSIFTFLPRLAESITDFLVLLFWVPWFVSALVIAYKKLKGELPASESEVSGFQENGEV